MFINKKSVETLGNNIFQEIKSDGYSYTLEKILVENNLLTDYNSLQLRFKAANVHYNFTCVDELAKVYGFRMEYVKGYTVLPDKFKKLFDQLILNFINQSGLEYKIHKLPQEVILELENNRFKIYTLGIDKFSYLNFNGSFY